MYLEKSLVLRQLSLQCLEGDPAAVGRGCRQRLARYAQLVAPSVAAAAPEQVAGRCQRVTGHRQLLLSE